MSVCKRGEMSKSNKGKTHYVDYRDLSAALTGEPEMRAVERELVALRARPDVSNFEICPLTGCVEPGVIKTRLKMIEDRNCQRGGTPIAIPTTSWAEEGCTLDINGLIDTNEQTIVDRNGFLHQVPSDECTTEQRLGRGLRIFNVLYALQQK